MNTGVTTNETTDQDLVTRALEGDQDSFAILVERHQQAVYNLTYRMLRNAREAEDAAQEAFLRAYQHLNRYDPSRSFKTWLMSIASNHCIDRIRKRRLTWLSIDEPLPPHPALNSNAPAPEAAVVASEASDPLNTGRRSSCATGTICRILRLRNRWIRPKAQSNHGFTGPGKCWPTASRAEQPRNCLWQWRAPDGTQSL